VSTNYDFLDPSIDRRLAADVDAAEGNELVAYPDSLGNWTCGRGHLLPPAAPGRSWEGFTIVEATSDRWFCQDLLNATALAKKWPEFKQCDTACRQNALIEIAFNLGSKWDKFVNTRAAITEQNWQAAHDGLIASAADHEEPKRIARLATYFLTGEYPA
jgi:GH24 family phage-related lysozyme (muramidase)